MKKAEGYWLFASSPSSLLRRNGAIMETKQPMTAIVAKDTRKFDAAAIWPIIGGPMRNPRKPMLETVAMAMPEGILRERPAEE